MQFRYIVKETQNAGVSSPQVKPESVDEAPKSLEKDSHGPSEGASILGQNSGNGTSQARSGPTVRRVNPAPQQQRTPAEMDRDPLAAQRNQLSASERIQSLQRDPSYETLMRQSQQMQPSSVHGIMPSSTAYTRPHTSSLNQVAQNRQPPSTTGNTPSSVDATVRSHAQAHQYQREQLLFQQRLEQQRLQINQCYTAAVQHEQQYRHLLAQQQSSAMNRSAPQSRPNASVQHQHQLRPYPMPYAPVSKIPYNAFRPIAPRDVSSSTVPSGQAVVNTQKRSRKPRKHSSGSVGPQVIQPIAPQPPVQVIQAPYVLSDAILKYVEENVPLLEREYVKARLVAYVNMMTQTKISQMPPHASSPFTPNILVTPQDIVTIMGQRLAPTESTVSIDKFSSVSSNLPSRQENGSVEPGPTCGSHTPIETNATSVQPNTQYKNGSVVADPPHSNSPIRMKPSRSIDSDSDRSLKKAKLRTESPTLVDDDVIVIEEDFKDPEMESESVPKAKAKKETVTGPLPSRSFQWQDGFVQGFFFYLGKDSPFGSVKDDDALSADWLDGFKTGTRYVETKEKEGLK